MDQIRPYLMTFLRALEHAVPPPVGQTHSIFLGRVGSEAAEWDYRLAVFVRGPDMPLYIDDGDFAKPIKQLVDECLGVLARAQQTAASPPPDDA